MPSFKSWAKSARSPFLVASAIPVIFGGTLAYLHIGVFDWLIFLITFAAIVLMHAAANMTNEYFDYKNQTDIVNKNRTVFSGGSGLLVEGKMTLKQYKIAFSILYILAFSAGAFLIIHTGIKAWVIITLALTGFILTYFYSCPPINLAHRGLGEITIGLCFGPLPIFGTYFVLTGEFSWIPILASLPIMMLIIAVLYINQYPDIEADSFAGKKNLVVRLGRKRSKPVYYLLIAATYLFIPLLALIEYLPWYSLFAFLSIPIAIKSSMILHRKFEDPKGIFPAMGLTILNHHITGLLLIGSVIIAGITQ